jgi:hypothetical protein
MIPSPLPPFPPRPLDSPQASDRSGWMALIVSITNAHSVLKKLGQRSRMTWRISSRIPNSFPTSSNHSKPHWIINFFFSFFQTQCRGDLSSPEPNLEIHFGKTVKVWPDFYSLPIRPFFPRIPTQVDFKVPPLPKLFPNPRSSHSLIICQGRGLFDHSMECFWTSLSCNCTLSFFWSAFRLWIRSKQAFSEQTFF